MKNNFFSFLQVRINNNVWFPKCFIKNIFDGSNRFCDNLEHHFSLCKGSQKFFFLSNQVLQKFNQAR